MERLCARPVHPLKRPAHVRHSGLRPAPRASADSAPANSVRPDHEVMGIYIYGAQRRCRCLRSDCPTD